jgi:CRP-like cAMP-binding protein
MFCQSPLMLVEPDHVMNRERDRPVFREGDPPGALYRVEQGCIRLQKSSRCGQRQIVSFCHPGDLFGLGAFGPSNVDAEAVCPTVVSRLSEARLMRLLQSDPVSGLSILESAHGGRDTITELLGMLCRASSGQRLSWFINGLSRRVGRRIGGTMNVDLPMLRMDIADHLGMTFETVSREMAKLRKSRIIDVIGLRQIAILRPQWLHTLAQADGSADTHISSHGQSLATQTKSQKTGVPCALGGMGSL